MTTTTTTERPRSAPARATGSNLRLYLTTFLATAYVITWWLFGARAPTGSAELPLIERVSEASGQPRMATWFDDLPPAARPVVEVPEGWHIADRTAGAATSVTRRTVPVPARASPTRAGRIRTRSS